MAMANGDYIKVKEIEQMNVHDFLTYLSYSRAKVDFENEINKV